MHPTASPSHLASRGRLRISLALASLLAVATACGSDSPTEPGSGSLAVDAAAAEAQRAQIRSALEAPVIVSLLGAPDEDDDVFPFPVVARRSDPSSPEALLARTREQVGLSLSVARGGESAPAPSFIATANLAGAALAGEIAPFVEPSIWGQTFVRTGYSGYEVDPLATGAPARGARVILYERLSSGDFSNVAVGYVDLIDSTTATLQIGRVNVYDIDGDAMGSLRVTVAEKVAGSLATTTLTFSGTLGPVGQQFLFDDTYSVTTNVDAADFEGFEMAIRASIHSRAPFANVAIRMDLAYDFSGMEIDAEVQAGGRRLRIESSIRYDDMDADVIPNARIHLDGRLVGVVDPETGALMAPSGGPVTADLDRFGEAATGILATMPVGALHVSSELSSMLNSLAY